MKLCALSLRVFFFVLLAETAALDCAAVDFGALPYTDNQTLQGVDASGGPTYPAGGFPLKMIGVVLNTPADMSDSTPHFAVSPFDVSTYWQFFVQSIDINSTGDFGGTAVYMAQNYGNVPPSLTFPGGVPTPDPAANYSDAEWQSQLDRVNSYAQNAPGTLPSAGYQLQAGDLVEIDARGGLFFGGKFNVNEEHFKTPDYASDPGLSFDIKYLGHPGLPTPTHIELADIWDSLSNAVKFDPTGATGGEHYQGSYVSLDNVRLTAGEASQWVSNGLVSVEDGAGRTFMMQLGTSALFTPASAPTGWFNAVGIFDQEAASGGPFNTGYEVWVMDPALVTPAPEPSALILAALAALGLCGLKLRRGKRESL